MNWCIVDSIYCIKNNINNCTCLLITPIWSPFHARNWTSDHAISAVLLQHTSSEGSPLLPVTFYSKKLNAAEQKYPVHDHEMLAIIQACSKWRCYLFNKGIVVYTDHKPLQYLQVQPNSMPATCVGWILWLITGWMFAIGQARPTLF